MVTGLLGLSPGWTGRFSILRTRDLLVRTCPKTTCLPSRCGVGTVVMKNWEPLVPVYKSPVSSIPINRKDFVLVNVITGSSIRHRQQKRLLMLQVEILILELRPINTLPTRSIASSKIPALDHKLLDDAVETTSLIGQGHAGLAVAFFAGAEGAEVVGGFGDHIVVELEGDAAGGFAAD